MKKFGFDLLTEQAADAVASQVAMLGAGADQNAMFGDSPVERLFSAALSVRLRYGENEWFEGAFFAAPTLTFAEIEEKLVDPYTLALQRQVTLPNIGRVDFILHCRADWAREPSGGIPGWRRLVIECDGHDFHERTKEQASRDRSRDRAVQLAGMEVFRFTGSELWRNPWGCADQVVQWANRGV